MKKCPQCGADVAEASKFCTNCGYAFPATQPAAAATPEPQPASQPQSKPQPQPEPEAPKAATTDAQAGSANGQMTPPPPIASFNTEQAKAAGRNYWQYFVDSLLHPLNFETQAHPYFGFVSMAILAVISTFNVWNFLGNINDSLTALVRWFANLSVLMDGGDGSVDSMVNDVMTTQVQESIKSAIGNVSAGTCVKFILAFAVVVLLYLGLAYLIRHSISGDQKDFMAFSVDFGRFFAPMIVVALLITVFSLSGSMKFTFWLLVLNAMIFNVGFVASVLYQRKATGFDVMFATIIAEIVMMVVVLWLTKTIVTGTISGLITELAKSFGSSSDGITEFLDLLKYL